jgi:hypothetical protein
VDKKNDKKNQNLTTFSLSAISQNKTKNQLSITNWVLILEGELLKNLRSLSLKNQNTQTQWRSQDFGSGGSRFLVFIFIYFYERKEKLKLNKN